MYMGVEYVKISEYCQNSLHISHMYIKYIVLFKVIRTSDHFMS